MPKKIPKKKVTDKNQVRIISGDWRGRKLGFPSVEGLRPTGDRIRETLFNWLAPDLAGMDCADLFAGSGALGLEALSRGVNRADLIELNNLAAKSLQNNLDLLECQRGHVFQKSAESYLKRSMARSLDLIFLDPPFEEKMHNQIIAQIGQSGVMRKDGLVYIEAPLDSQLILPENWLLQRKKSAGQVSYSLFRVN